MVEGDGKMADKEYFSMLVIPMYGIEGVCEMCEKKKPEYWVEDFAFGICHDCYDDVKKDTERNKYNSSKVLVTYDKAQDITDQFDILMICLMIFLLGIVLSWAITMVDLLLKISVFGLAFVGVIIIFRREILGLWLDK